MHNEKNLNLLVGIGKVGIYTVIAGTAIMGASIVAGLIYVGTAPNPK